MSFYIYYGKLGNELVVAILPNGTVELDDTLYLSSKKGLVSHRARDVTTTEEGEERFTFFDINYEYAVESRKGYKELSLIRSNGKGEKVKTIFTRKYDQSQAAHPSTTKPKVWTGEFQFHDWAKDEEIVIVAPQGLGNKKPVICFWQWTSDQNKEKGVVCHSLSEQQSDAATPKKFSFLQNGYYTVTCEVDADDDLKVAVKGPANSGEKNASVTQKDLKAAKVQFGAEHRFTPTVDNRKPVQLDCLIPNSKPYLKKVTKPLPFPTSLLETLSHSAAYVDYAGFLAQYATKQFDKLDASYHKLEKKCVAKDATIEKLNEKVVDLEKANQKLDLLNKDQANRIETITKAAAVREADLQGKLDKALKALSDSEVNVQGLQRVIEEQSKYIAEDKRKDIERDCNFQKHISKDHEALKQQAIALKDANEANAQLRKDLACKNQTISELKAELRCVKDQLEAANSTIRQLKADVAFERRQKSELQEKLASLEKQLADAVRDLAHLRAENANLKIDLTAEKEENAVLNTQNLNLTKKLQEVEHDLSKAETEKKELARKLTAVKTELETAARTITMLNSEIEEKAEEIENREAECELKEKRLKLANADIDQKDTELDAFRKKHEKVIKEYKLEIERMKTPQVAITEISADA